MLLLTLNNHCVAVLQIDHGKQARVKNENPFGDYYDNPPER